MKQEEAIKIKNEVWKKSVPLFILQLIEEAAKKGEYEVRVSAKLIKEDLNKVVGGLRLLGYYVFVGNVGWMLLPKYELIISF